MKKILLVVVGAAVVAAVGVVGFNAYNQKAEAKAFEEQMSQTITSLPPIVVYEKAELPSIDEEFAGTDSMINISSVTPDISNVYTTEPGEYEVIYTFKDVKGTERTATVPCTVKPDLLTHVTGMQDITIDEGEALPEQAPCTYDDYVASVTLDTSRVDTKVAGVYDISYTILGADGDMQTADGYTCTVKAAAPLPTPTPTPAPEPTEKPKQKEKTKTKTKVTATPTPTATPKPKKTTQNTQQQRPSTPEVGNVEVEETPVQTGDTNDLLALISLFGISAVAVAGAAVYRKKRHF